MSKNKLDKILKINNVYYNYKEYEKIIHNINDNRNKIRDIILPKAKYEYNNILFEISKL